MNLYFNYESHVTLKSFTLFITVKAITKLNLGHIDKSEIKIEKTSRWGSPSPDNTELGHLTFLFCRRRQRNVQRFTTHVHQEPWCKACTKSSQSSAFPHPKLPQSYARIPKGRNGWKTTEKQLKRQRIVLKRLVKQRKHYLSLARRSFKNQKKIKRKRQAGNILQKREVFGQNGRVGISAVFITFHKLYQQHSERFSLRSNMDVKYTIEDHSSLIWLAIIKKRPRKPVPYACAQPYHLGIGSQEQLFQPC